MSQKSGNQYTPLMNVSDRTPEWMRYKSVKIAEMWPGFPKNPIAPNPIPVRTPTISPQPPLGGRHTQRGRGYVSLSNYNNLP